MKTIIYHYINGFNIFNGPNLQTSFIKSSLEVEFINMIDDDDAIDGIIITFVDVSSIVWLYIYIYICIVVFQKV